MMQAPGDARQEDDGAQARGADAARVEEASDLRVPLPRLLLACTLGWAVPGLGHLLLGRLRRGALFALVVFGFFVVGLVLEGKVHRPVSGEPLTYLAALGAAGAGAPFILAHASGLAEGDMESATYDYGSTFTLIAGLLNLLVLLDVYDVALRRR